MAHKAKRSRSTKTEPRAGVRKSKRARIDETEQKEPLPQKRPCDCAFCVRVWDMQKYDETYDAAEKLVKAAEKKDVEWCNNERSLSRLAYLSVAGYTWTAVFHQVASRYVDHWIYAAANDEKEKNSDLHDFSMAPRRARILTGYILGLWKYCGSPNWPLIANLSRILVDLRPENPCHHYDLIVSLRNAERSTAAEAALNAACARFPEHSDWFLRGTQRTERYNRSDATDKAQ